MKRKLIARLGVVLVAWVSCAAAQDEIYVERLSSIGVFASAISHASLSFTKPFIALTSSDKALKVIDLSNQKDVFSYPILPNALVALRWARNGQLLTGRIDGQMNYWNPLAGAMLRSVTAHSEGIFDFDLAPGGTIFLAGSDQVLKTIDPATGKELNSLSVGQDKITSFALHPSGKTAVVGSAGKLMVFDSLLNQTRVLTELQETATALFFSRDGKSLVSGGSDGTVRVWETAGWGLKRTQNAFRGSIAGFDMDPRGRWIVSVAGDSAANIYDLATLKVVKRMRDPEAAFTFASFLNDETLVTGDSKGTVILWKVLDRPPDTTAPAFTILQPARYSQDSPSKVYATQYQVIGLAYDESEIKEVKVGEVKAAVGASRVQNGGLKGSEFNATVNLATVGANSFEVKITDASGNSSAQTIYIQRLSNAQAVEILAPVQDVETDKVAIEVQFKPWFEVASYSISANAMDIVDQRGPLKVKAGDVVKEEIPLIVGYNQISLVLTSKKGERISKLIGVNRKFSAAVTEAIRNAPAQRTSTGPQRWAVVVGVSEYANTAIPALKYADKDAEGIAAFLQTPEGGGFDNDHMRILINKDATLSNLREAMIDFLQQAIDKDLVLIYFAGHGAPDPTRPQNLYLLTHDTDPGRLGTTAFPMWDIQTVIARQIAAKKVVVLSDACHSGGISVDVTTRGLGFTDSNPINQYLAELSRTKDGMVVFTASAAGEVSQEFPELGHGVFTYYLLEGLKGAADQNNDYLVTVNELMGFVEEQVKRKTRGAQNPTRSQTTYDKELPMAIINK